MMMNDNLNMLISSTGGGSSVTKLNQNFNLINTNLTKNTP